MVHNPCHMNWNKPPLFNWVIEQWYIYIHIIHTSEYRLIKKKHSHELHAGCSTCFFSWPVGFVWICLSFVPRGIFTSSRGPSLSAACRREASGDQRYDDVSGCICVYLHTSHINSHLVGDWNIWIIFPYIGNNDPNWLIFFRGVGQPATSVYLHTSSHINSHILNMSKLCWSAFYRRSPVEFFGCTSPSPIQFTKETAW